MTTTKETAAMMAIVRRVAEISDPDDRAEAADAAIEALNFAAGELVKVRRGCIAELLAKGNGVANVAGRVGMSASTVKAVKAEMALTAAQAAAAAAAAPPPVDPPAARSAPEQPAPAPAAPAAPPRSTKPKTQTTAPAAPSAAPSVDPDSDEMRRFRQHFNGVAPLPGAVTESVPETASRTEWEREALEKRAEVLGTTRKP